VLLQIVFLVSPLLGVFPGLGPDFEAVVDEHRLMELQVVSLQMRLHALFV
jgi:hypothetical protein